MNLFKWIGLYFNSDKREKILLSLETEEGESSSSAKKTKVNSSKVDALLENNPIYPHYQEVLKLTEDILANKLTFFDDELNTIYETERFRLRADIGEKRPSVLVAYQHVEEGDIFYEHVIAVEREYGRTRSVTKIQQDDKFVDCDLSKATVVKRIISNVEKIEKIVRAKGLKEINENPINVLEIANESAKKSSKIIEG